REARQSALLSASMECIVTADQDGRILQFNSAALRTFGYAQDQVVGRTLEEIVIPPSLHREYRTGLAECRGKTTGAVLGKLREITEMRADGAEFPAELTVVHAGIE